MTLSLSSSSVVDGVRERAFTVGDVPGVLWDADPGPGSGSADPAGARRRTAQDGARHRRPRPAVRDRARRGRRGDRCAGSRRPSARSGARGAGGRAACPDGGRRAGHCAPRPGQRAGRGRGGRVACRARRAARGRIGPGAVGFWGVSMGCATGIPLVAAESRITAAVLGLAGADGLAAVAARSPCRWSSCVQWDDEFVTRASALALFDAFGSAEKTLHANSGGHMALPRFEVESAVRFFTRHVCRPQPARGLIPPIRPSQPRGPCSTRSSRSARRSRPRIIGNIRWFRANLSRWRFRNSQ